MRRTLLRALLALGTLLPTSVLAAGDPPPAPDHWVTDVAGLLSPGTRAALEQRLDGYSKETGHQVVVWIGKTTAGVPIEDWAERAFQAWKVGRQGLDDGLLLVLFVEDRRMRIEVGYGLEPVVPDAIASRIIREVLAPGLREGRADAAVSSAIDALISAIEGKPYSPKPGGVGHDRPSTPSWTRLVVYAIVGLFFLFLFITNPTLAIYLLFNILSGGRSGGFGSSSGGFRGGGGRSGGGGASGSW